MLLIVCLVLLLMYVVISVNNILILINYNII